MPSCRTRWHVLRVCHVRKKNGLLDCSRLCASELIDLAVTSYYFYTFSYLCARSALSKLPLNDISSSYIIITHLVYPLPLAAEDVARKEEHTVVSVSQAGSAVGLSL